MRIARAILAAACVAFAPAAQAKEQPFAAAVEKLAAAIHERVPSGSKVAVGSIYDRDRKISYLGRYLCDKLQGELVDKKGVVVVERDRLDIIVDELRLQKTGLFDERTAQNTGRMAGADVIVYGVLTDLETTLDVDLKVLDVASSKLLGTAAERFQKSPELVSMLSGVISSERRKLEEARRDYLKSADENRVRIAALETDIADLKRAAHEGIWRGGPSVEEFPVERPGLSTGTWSWYASAAGGLITDRPSGTLGFFVRSPSGHWETHMDGGRLSKRAYAEPNHPNAVTIPYKYAETQQLDVTFVRLHESFLHRATYLGIPGLYRVRTPAIVRVGAGIGLYRVRTHYNLSLFNQPPGVDSSRSNTATDSTAMFVAPILEAGLGKTLSNVFEIDLTFEYVFAREFKGMEARIGFGGPSFLVRFGYRLF
ncbi:MAG: hypothetical protein HY553_16205 [Elusimicrobia bacterium]|nr:hypothetical protein [Elusimicrobiota bacterium]